MSVYRKLARSKKGMSTIFAGLFMVILILMGFNLMLWNFIQLDAYNTVISGMNQRDQLAASENVVPVNPGATDFNSPLNLFNITANNLGGTSVSIARIYITNISPTGTTPTLCAGSNAPCIVEAAPSSTSYSFTLGNFQVGEINHKIQVKGLQINDGSGYKVVLASTRGRLFSFFFPWPQAIPNNGQGVFQTNIGPLTIFFDFKSFNFTMGTQTTSQTAWVSPTSTPMVFWLKVTNSATDSSVRLRVMSAMLFQPYSAGGVGAYSVFFISSPNTVNPSNLQAYDDVNGPFYDLPAANPNGPSNSVLVKFGSSTQGGAGTVGFPTSEKTWVVFIGFYYMFKGNLQGQTIPFVAMKTCSAFPAASCY